MGNGIEADGGDTRRNGGGRGYGANQQQFVHQGGKAALDGGGGECGHGGSFKTENRPSERAETFGLRDRAVSDGLGRLREAG